MTANMQDYNSPQLPRYIMGGKGWGMLSQTNQQLNAPLNHTAKYRKAAHTLGRPLTIAKGRTLATATRAAECTHWR